MRSKFGNLLSIFYRIYFCKVEFTFSIDQSLLKEEKNADDLTNFVHDKVLNLGTNLLNEIYETLDDEIRESIIRKKHWI